MNSISALELYHRLHLNEDIVLIDVRTSSEREEYHIGGLHLPLDEILEHISLIPKDKSVVIYCRKGIRSMIAIQRIQQKLDYQNVFNLQGGIDAWKKITNK